MYNGPHTQIEGLVYALDASSQRSNMRVLQSKNLLNDPNTWTAGSGGQTGYSANGGSAEQNRATQSDDPWGRTSMIWQSKPDVVSGADGGWNSSYYSVDTSYTYRWVQWVRRYTTGTGGTFYMGLNPAQIRNDNGNLQGNPYWNCPAISSLTYDQWYCVVNHVMFQGYTGGRNPESGWYANGVRVNDVGFCNVGSQDMRWNPGTTSVNHRTYHYYTTNVNSGIEWCYPRIDKIDGTEPSLSELLHRGESGFLDINDSSNFGNVQGWSWNKREGINSSYSFDGTDDYISTGEFSGRNVTSAPFTVEAVVKADVALTKNMMWLDHGSNGSNQRVYASLCTPSRGGNFGIQNQGWSNGSAGDTDYHHQCLVMDGSTARMYCDGAQVGTKSYSSYTIPNPLRVGGRASYFWDGEIPVYKIYDRALSATEVAANADTYRTRFGFNNPA